MIKNSNEGSIRGHYEHIHPPVPTYSFGYYCESVINFEVNKGIIN